MYNPPENEDVEPKNQPIAKSGKSSEPSTSMT